MSWNPETWGSIGNWPVIGGIWNGITGNPDAMKAAYDQQIQASKEAQAQLQQFLMGQKGAAQATYAPMQHMFNSMYGTEGMAAPQVPQAPGRTQTMYQSK